MKPSAYYVVDVMEELIKFTLLVRGRSDYLVDRYSERKGMEQATALAAAAGVVETVLNKGKCVNAVIYHNPNCGTSRNTLALIRFVGIEPEVIDYLANPPSRAR